MKPSAPARPGERAFGALLLLASILAFREAHAISGFSGLTTAGAMPMVAAGVMVVSAAIVLRRSLARPASGATARETARHLAPRRLLIFAPLLAAYAAAIGWIGFLAASAGFLFATLMLFWRRGPLPAALVTAGAILAIHLLFREVFQVVLPMGAIWR